MPMHFIETDSCPAGGLMPVRTTPMLRVATMLDHGTSDVDPGRAYLVLRAPLRRPRARALAPNAQPRKREPGNETTQTRSGGRNQFYRWP